jgi:hypothetical protein
MITIKELHKYKKMADAGFAPALVCPVDSLHTDMVPWTEDDKVCLWCIYCNSKVFLGEDRENFIKSIIY